jgi:hypothetical protein
MVSVAAAFREGRRVTKVPQNTEDTLVKDVESERGEPGPASLGLPNDDVSLASEGAEERMSRSSLIFGGGHDRQAAITGSS